MVHRREPLQQLQLRSELQKAFAEVPYAVPASVVGHHIDVSLGICCRPWTELPGTLLGAAIYFSPLIPEGL